MRLAAARPRETPAVTTRSSFHPPAHGRAAKGCLGQVQRPNLRKIHSFPLFPLANNTQKAMLNNQTQALINWPEGTGFDINAGHGSRLSRPPSETGRFGLS